MKTISGPGVRTTSTNNRSANVGQYSRTSQVYELDQEARQYADLAKEWAVSEEEVEPGLHSAKYYAEVAGGNVEDIIEEGDKQVARVEAAGDAELDKVSGAADSEIVRVGEAGDAQVVRVLDTGDTVVINVGLAGLAQISDIQDAGAEQIDLIESSGQGFVDDAETAALAAAASAVESEASAVRSEAQAQILEDMEAEANTVAPGSPADADWDNTTGTMTFSIPQGPQGPQGVPGVGVVVKDTIPFADIFLILDAEAGDSYFISDDGPHTMPPQGTSQDGEDFNKGDLLTWVESGHWWATELGVDFDDDVDFGSNIIITSPNQLQARENNLAVAENLISMDIDTDISVGGWDSSTWVGLHRLGLIVSDNDGIGGDAYVVREVNNTSEQFPIVHTGNLSESGVATEQSVVDAIDTANTYTDDSISAIPPVDISGKADITYVDAQDDALSDRIDALELEPGGVSSWNQRTGNVLPEAGDYSVGDITGAASEAYVDSENALQDVEIATKANDTEVLHIVGDETVSGIKTFETELKIQAENGGTSRIVFEDETNLRTTIESTPTSGLTFTTEGTSENVNISQGNIFIQGTPTAGGHLANILYTDTHYVSLTEDQTVEGEKTFTDLNIDYGRLN